MRPVWVIEGGVYGSEAEMPLEDSQSVNCEKYTSRVEIKTRITAAL